MDKICNNHVGDVRHALYRLAAFNFLIIFFTATCAENRLAGRYDPLLGTWRTEKGILMAVQMSDSQGAEASITMAPGFLGDDVKSGKVIIHSIKPVADGGWSGLFEMPGNLKPVKVDISIFSGDTMLIISRDKRVKKRRMVWHRMDKE